MTIEFLKSINPKNHQFKTYTQLGHSAGDQVRERERERESERERERRVCVYQFLQELIDVQEWIANLLPPQGGAM